MFRNYLVAALRNIVRHKLYSFINIAGLAVGLACVIFIILFIRDEISYDKWIPGSENLYRVENTINEPGHDPTDSAVHDGHQREPSLSGKGGRRRSGVLSGDQAAAGGG